jgi:hypothetical protein
MPASRGVVAVLALLLLAAAGDDLRRELNVAASQRHVSEVSGECGETGGEPRARLADALCLARTAVSLPPGPRRDAILNTASTAARTAVGARPFWPDALTVSAYIDSQTGDPASFDSARRALALSYMGAPYLSDAADWRIGFGLSQWHELSGATQNAVAAEAMWQIAVDPDRSDTLFAKFRASPAYIPFILRWRALSIDWQRRTQGLSPG